MRLKGICLAISLISCIPYKGASQDHCFIKSYKKILIIDSNSTRSNQVIKESNCPVKLQQEFTQHLLGYQNLVPTDHLLKVHLGQNSKMKVKISPTNIHLLHYKDLLEERFIKDQKTVISQISPVENISSIPIKEGISINVQCLACQHLGNRSSILSLTDNDGNHLKKHAISIKLGRKVFALVSRQNVRAFAREDLNHYFEIKEITSSQPEQYFQDSEKLKYYRINKNISKDTPLRYRDLTAQTIVKRGDTVNVVYKNNKLSLRMTGVSQNSGKYGDTISVLNTKSKQSFSAKIVDMKTAEISL